MDSIVDMLKCIMGCPLVDEPVRDQASALLKKIAPTQHPANQAWSSIFGDIWGAGK